MASVRATSGGIVLFKQVPPNERVGKTHTFRLRAHDIRRNANGEKMKAEEETR